jgi:hypothetical protein
MAVPLLPIALEVVSVLVSSTVGLLLMTHGVGIALLLREQPCPLILALPEREAV